MKDYHIELDSILKSNKNIINNIYRFYNVVTFENAISNWSLGMNISCYLEDHSYTYCFRGKNFILVDDFFDISITKEMVNKGVWYIDE